MQGGKEFTGLLQLFAAVPFAVLPLPQLAPPRPEQPCVPTCHPIRLSLGLVCSTSRNTVHPVSPPQTPSFFLPPGSLYGSL